MFNQFNRCIACFNFCLYFDIFAAFHRHHREDSLFDCGGMPAEIIGELGLVIEFQLLLVGCKEIEHFGRISQPPPVTVGTIP